MRCLRNPASLLALLGALLAVGCGGPVTKELETARQKWAAQSLRSAYRFDFTQSCFCQEAGETVVIQVKDGEATSIVRKKDGSLVTDELGWRPTIDTLLEKVARANAEADELTATFDPALGYPASVSIDWIKGAIDDELAFTVANVEAAE